MLPDTHLRIARPTDALEEVVHFYRDGLGMQVLGSFEDHAGFSGAMLGDGRSGHHLEFTTHPEHPAGRAPTQDHLLVFYLPEKAAWREAVERLQAIGVEPVAALNPYWDVHGLTFEDPDGYRIVLQNAACPDYA
ncbi:MAG: VOC family protein [Planctomycetota bacterium]